MQTRNNPWNQSLHRSTRSRILVVDDENYILALVRGALPSGNFDVKTAHSAQEARGLLAHIRFDLALIDVRMPIESGVDFVRELRTTHPTLKILMMTGGEAPIDDFAFEDGDVIFKPILREQLREAVTNALQQVREHRNQMTLEPYTATVAFARRRRTPTPEDEVTANALEAAKSKATATPASKLRVKPAPGPDAKASPEPIRQAPSTHTPTNKPRISAQSIEPSEPSPQEAATLSAALAEFRGRHKTVDSSVQVASSRAADMPTQTVPHLDVDRTADASSMPPLVIDGFTLLRPLAASEFAVVYLAMREVDGKLRKFGVKIIHLDQNDPHAARKLERLRQEEELLKQVAHPCLVKPV
jgi:DNA-binding response OmpR family regulator